MNAATRVAESWLLDHALKQRRRSRVCFRGGPALHRTRRRSAHAAKVGRRASHNRTLKSRRVIG